MADDIKLKILGIFSAIVLVLNLLLFVIGKLSLRTFWMIILAACFLVYFVMPWMRKE